MKRAHFILGITLVVVFLLTGQYMEYVHMIMIAPAFCSRVSFMNRREAQTKRKLLRMAFFATSLGMLLHLVSGGREAAKKFETNHHFYLDSGDKELAFPGGAKEQGR